MVDCKLPPAAFDVVLGTMAQPTSSKWQVMYDICNKLSPLLEPAHGHASSLPQLEVFFKKLLELLPGSAKPSINGKRVAHQHTEKIQVFAGLLADLELYALIYLTIDFWEANCQVPGPRCCCHSHRYSIECYHHIYPSSSLRTSTSSLGAPQGLETLRSLTFAI